MRFINFKNNTQKGFTLIEMLVSIALFSVVLTVTLGTIMTIVDSNRKARSLMSVTNNLNFAVDSMVRSFKSGDVADILGGGDIIVDPSKECFRTFEVNYAALSGSPDFSEKRWVEYCKNGDGVLTKEIGDEYGSISGGVAVPLTSPDVKIDTLEFQISGETDGQPFLTIILAGTVKVSEKISSSFSIQTSVSQRKLNII